MCESQACTSMCNVTCRVDKEILHGDTEAPGPQGTAVSYFAVAVCEFLCMYVRNDVFE